MAMVPAVLGYARLANFRLGYLPARLNAVRSARVNILLAGADARTRVRVGSLTIRDVINDSPNTCEFLIDGTAPNVGDSLRILLGTDQRQLLFNGAVQTVDMTYDALPSQVVWRVTAIDDTERLNRFRPFGAFTNWSATALAQTLIANFAPGFTATHVQADLEAVSVNLDTTEGFSGALKQIAKLIGGYFYVEDMDLHLFTEETTEPPDPVDDDHPPLDDPHITLSTDYSQLRTRVFGKGGGVTALTALVPGETTLPVDDVAWYDPTGGMVVAPGTQRITYTGTVAGGVGGLVGPGAAPSSAPTVTVAAGAGIETGEHKYAYTFVTASGESLPSPLKAVTLGTLPHPASSAVPVFVLDPAFPVGGVPIPAGTVLEYTTGYMDLTGTQLSALTPTTFPRTATGAHGKFQVYFTITAAMVGYIPIIARRDNGGTYYWVAVGSPVTAGEVGSQRILTDIYKTAPELGGAYSPTSFQRATLTIPISSQSGVTSRKVYRTAAGAAVLKLLTTSTTYNNNTFTGPFTDDDADATLGATAPTSDASGLTQPNGQALAGDTSLIVAGTGPFAAGGGWAVVGNGQQIIRYSGKTETALTGIPATGGGAITASISFNSTITVAPALTGIPASGVGAIVYAINEGDPVNIWIQRDDLAAQALYGIHEGPPLVDERRATPSLTALCDAELALYARPIQTVPYATRDTKTKSGKTVTIDLASPPISATLVIQDVTITEIEVAPGLLPKFTATASSVRFSIFDVMRRAAAEQTA